MKPRSFCKPSTVDSICRRGALGLFGALAVALVAGLVAAGPLDWRADGVQHGIEARYGHPWLDVLVLLASAALTLVGVWGWRSTRHVAAPPAMAFAVWRCLFSSFAALGLSSGLHHAIGAEGARVLAELCCAVGFTMLFLALMAERVDVWFGSLVARVVGLAFATAATAWWAWGWVTHGAGDARGLLFFGLLPALLLPAGAAGLPVKSGRGDAALMMLGVLFCSRLAALVAESWLTPPAALATQAAMLACCAAGAAWCAHRLAQSAYCVPEVSVSPSARSTSLKTSA